jgi:hypothetical protein
VDLDRARVERFGRSLADVLESGHVIADVSTVRRGGVAAGGASGCGRSRLAGSYRHDRGRLAGWAVRQDREPTEEDRAVLRDRLGYLGAVLGRQ